MGAPRPERPRWLGTLLGTLLAWLATARAISACPRPCACHGPAELHCTFRYLSAVPPRIPPAAQRINLGYVHPQFPEPQPAGLPTLCTALTNLPDLGIKINQIDKSTEFSVLQCSAAAAATAGKA